MTKKDQQIIDEHPGLSAYDLFSGGFGFSQKGYDELSAKAPQSLVRPLNAPPTVIADITAAAAPKLTPNLLVAEAVTPTTKHQIIPALTVFKPQHHGAHDTTGVVNVLVKSTGRIQPFAPVTAAKMIKRHPNDYSYA